MKLWHWYSTNRILLIITVCVLILVGGTIALILTIDNPRYAPGEATAMVEYAYHWQYNSADLYSPLSEEYLGQGIWEVKSSGYYPLTTLGWGQAVFRVYEETNTVKIYSAVVTTILNRREELEREQRELEQRLEELEKPPTQPKTTPEWGGLGPNPFR